MLPQFPIIDRSEQLQQLLGAWRDVCRSGNGPRLITITGEPGYGKTRLVREFYNQIVQAQLPGDVYWPLNLHEDDVNPKFSDGQSPAEMPWLWWGIRCASTEQRNRAQDEGCAFLRSGVHLKQHTDERDRKRSAAAKQKRLKTALLAPLWKLAEEIPVFGTIVRHYSSANDLLEACRSAVDAAKPPEATSPHRKTRREIQINCEALVETCKSFLDPTDSDLPTVPTILVVDDAHAADPQTIKCVYEILHFAHTKKLPLMVISTYWAKDWKLAESSIPPNLTNAESWTSFRQIESSLPMAHGADKDSVFTEIECEDIDCRQILAQLNIQLGETLEEHCIAFADGNPHMLHALLSALYEYRSQPANDSWFKDPSPELQLSDYGFHKFLECTKDLEEILKVRAKKVHKDRNLSKLLGLGALQGQSFLGEFTAEIWRDLEGLSHAKKDHLELLQSGETPHHVIRIFETAERRARFRHRTYRDAFLLPIDPKQREVYLNAISSKIKSWLERASDPATNADFISFAADWCLRNSNDPHLERALDSRADHLLQLGFPDKAVELLEERAERLTQRHGQSSAEANLANMRLAEALAESGKLEDAIRILEPLRAAFINQDELWIDCSRILSNALLKKAGADRISKQSSVTLASDMRSSATERDRGAEILREVWVHLQRQVSGDSAQALLAAMEYGKVVSEGGCDQAFPARHGMLILPSCARLLDDPPKNNLFRDVALVVLGKYLSAWNWPQETRVPSLRETCEAELFYKQNKSRVIKLRERYPEAQKAFFDLVRHRSVFLGAKHSATFEARRLELQSCVHWPRERRAKNGDRSAPHGDIRIEEFRKLVANAKSALGDHNPETLKCEAALADCLQGKEATAILQAVLERSRLSLGVKHPLTLRFKAKIESLQLNSLK